MIRASAPAFQSAVITLSWRWRMAALGACIAGVAIAGFVVSAGADASIGVEPSLVRLLRMIAVLKLAAVAGAFGLVAWRLRYPASLRLATGYAVACALMAAASGPIWNLDRIALAAVLFHSGLLLLLGLFALDGHHPPVARWSRLSRAAG